MTAPPSDLGDRKLSPEQAVSAGYWRVTFPTWIVMMGIIWPPIITLGFDQFGADVRLMGIVVGGALVLSWLTWSILAPIWRLWAYERVDDIEAVKQLAVSQKVVWSDRNWFSKTEIMTRATRDRLAALEAGGRVREGTVT